uniref:NADH-ubiquinone oxidoreductase chain 1 n=1 Tax=Tetrahymena rostrata TaxID=5909 RepID=A0A6G5NK34_TETRO|nr:NADH dehydrogenase subunit 1 [Tetrahymena rostrata]QBI37951.1 NADH dehydrogenase subunit 1 [Tetrahymena rostrata]URP31143.1 NADH dehydrogenase subunit 1 [Tetrahymena rostrata]
MSYWIAPLFINLLSIPLYLVIILYNIVCMLLITLVIASITLIERKVLSLIQRRVGPHYVGYRGRLQYIADALKLFIKGVIIPEGSNKFWFVTIPSMAGAVCYTFWMNSMWGPSVSIFEIEYNMVYATLLSILFSYCIMLTGYFSKSKYAFMASIRCAVLMLNIEIFLGLLVINLVFITESFCFSVFVIYQEIIWLIFIFIGVSGLIFITFLLETNRAPFDLAEAESELVTGYSVEYGGFYFALYYLGEYFHLFFFSMVLSIVLFGGWELPNFIYYFIINDFFLI